MNEWARANGLVFVPLEQDIQLEARNILATYPTLIDIRKGKGSADPFLVAAAKVRGGIIVTEENHSGGPPTKKIPDVCEVLQVPCIKLIELFRRENLRTRYNVA